MKQKGFTLIELMIVIMIIGILASVILPAIIDFGDDEDTKKIARDIGTIAKQAKDLVAEAKKEYAKGETEQAYLDIGQEPPKEKKDPIVKIKAKAQVRLTTGIEITCLDGYKAIKIGDDIFLYGKENEIYGYVEKIPCEGEL